MIQSLLIVACLSQGCIKYIIFHCFAGIAMCWKLLMFHLHFICSKCLLVNVYIFLDRMTSDLYILVVFLSCSRVYITLHLGLLSCLVLQVYLSAGSVWCFIYTLYSASLSWYILFRCFCRYFHLPEVSDLSILILF